MFVNRVNNDQNRRKDYNECYRYMQDFKQHFGW